MREFNRVTSFIAGQVRRLVRDQSGATAIEYAMIASGIAVAIIAAVNSLGTATSGMYGTVATALK
jgi:pilus assembly protein Flp/PilA